MKRILIYLLHAAAVVYSEVPWPTGAIQLACFDCLSEPCCCERGTLLWEPVTE